MACDFPLATVELEEDLFLSFATIELEEVACGFPFFGSCIFYFEKVLRNRMLVRNMFAVMLVT